jgi:hypothetical protein
VWRVYTNLVDAIERCHQCTYDPVSTRTLVTLARLLQVDAGEALFLHVAGGDDAAVDGGAGFARFEHFVLGQARASLRRRRRDRRNADLGVESVLSHLHSGTPWGFPEGYCQGFLIGILILTFTVLPLGFCANPRLR